MLTNENLCVTIVRKLKNERIEFLNDQGELLGLAPIQHTPNTLTIGSTRFNRQQ